MKVGLFTDAYHPNTNGVTYVVDILHKNLERLGHEVWIFAPEPRVRSWLKKREPRTVRFPAVEGLFFDEQLTSFFFPPRQLKRITDIDLDVIVIFTTGQVGLMGAYAAAENNIPLVQQYSTDIISYVERYPAVLPGVVALMLSLPVTLGVKPRELVELSRTMRAQRDPSLSRRQDVTRHIFNMLNDRCDLLIAVSEKSANQLKQYHGKTPTIVLPTGVNALPSSPTSTVKLRRHWKVKDNDVVCLYAGRLAVEKNIDMLLRAFSEASKNHDNMKLVLAGGFSHAEELKKLAKELKIDKKTIFAGRVPRSDLGHYYAASDIFCFPSLTDTQALVLNEAAHAGLPIIWCDPGLNKAASPNISGLLVKPEPASFATAIVYLAERPQLREKLSANAVRLAAELTEEKQTSKFASVLEKVIQKRR